MYGTAEENTPEVEVDNDTSEQIPDEVETENDTDNVEADDHENGEVETEEGDDSEQEFYFGDEKLDSPTSEEAKDPALVKHLRSTIKEKDRELKELRRLSTQPAQQQPVISQPPVMPKLTDPGIDYDEDLLQEKLEQWAKDNDQYKEQQRVIKQQQEMLNEQLKAKVTNYQQRVKSLKVRGFADAEQIVREEIPVSIQDAILLEAEKPEMVVLALGRNAELRKQLAETTNPVALGRLLERIESKAKTMPKAKTNAATTPEVKGSNGAVINNLDKLKAKALETGDWTPYFAAKKAKK
ncbi:scaffolding protein [Citrobacter werkmanii]|uniref:scaffolding protein n=1 Tax=Citrobacter werkmanii TaxID=67827 RepID=UPI000B422197|nr:scaffolding protein [Citrobacter werkmanii]RNW28982.1 scaffolding protein [Citrobacter werkmanii]